LITVWLLKNKYKTNTFTFISIINLSENIYFYDGRTPKFKKN